MTYKATISRDPKYDEWSYEWDDGISVSLIPEGEIGQFLITYLEACYNGCDRSLTLEII